MGEIDDLYKGEMEELDSSFLEELNKSEDKAKSFKKYRKDTLRARTQFSKSYEKFNNNERKRIAKMKKKLPKGEKFKRLTISHFDFEFNFWERSRMGLNVLLFNLGRKVRRFWSWVIPKWLTYNWCKVRNINRVAWGDFILWKEVEEESGKAGAGKVVVWIVEISKYIWGLVKALFGMVLFWRKAQPEKKEEESEEKEKDKKD